VCGIAGIYAYGPSAVNVERTELHAIRDHMAARGPDGAGAWLSDDARIGLGHRRLSIIDLSERGAQPMKDASGHLVVTFNGEIYNYRALRTELEAEGYRFTTESDTEVLLHLYAAKGRAMVDHLRGMFAFALWDGRRSALLLARDPYGIKPLYYADVEGTLRFASQVKALLAGGKLSANLDEAGWVGFHLFGSVPEPFTTYREIRALPAGSTLWVDSRGVGAPACYCNIAETYVRAEKKAAVPAGDLQGYLREALFDSVRHHMVADVPVGIFLSSGIDSGSLLGLMRDVGQQRIEAVTLGYEEFQNRHEDEAPLAAVCAARYDSRHTVRIVTEREFRDDLPRIFAAMDQPSIDGLNTWFVSKAARELGLKAAINGLGGDELFGGYPSFRDVPKWARLWSLPRWLEWLGDAFVQFAELSGLNTIVSPKIAGLLKYGGSYAGAYFLRRGLFMPWELSRVMDKEVAEKGLRRLQPLSYVGKILDPAPRSNFAKVAVLEASLYMRNQLLRDTDWASMAHSLEVRVPLVDVKLLEIVAGVSGALFEGAGKKLLANSPRTPLPAEIVERRKTGFITPINLWLQRDQRLQDWRRVPQLAQTGCPWARRWAYQLAATAA